MKYSFAIILSAILLMGCGFKNMLLTPDLSQVNNYMAWKQAEEADLNTLMGSSDEAIRQRFGEPKKILNADPPKNNFPKGGDVMWVYEKLTGHKGKFYKFIFKSRKLVLVQAI